MVGESTTHIAETGLTNALRAGYLGESTRSEGPQAEASGLRHPSPMVLVPSGAMAYFTGGGIAGGSHDGRAPLDAPAPPPGSSQTGAGSSNSPFTPIVALLALLALAVPAASRRLGMGPDFRAPTPFVCALERPG